MEGNLWPIMIKLRPAAGLVRSFNEILEISNLLIIDDKLSFSQINTA